MLRNVNYFIKSPASLRGGGGGGGRENRAGGGGGGGGGKQPAGGEGDFGGRGMDRRCPDGADEGREALI